MHASRVRAVRASHALRACVASCGVATYVHPYVMYGYVRVIIMYNLYLNSLFFKDYIYLSYVDQISVVDNE